MNYLEIKNKFPFRSSFLYIDCEQYVADRLFLDHGLNWVRFNKYELHHEATGFVMVYCSIFTKDKELFNECMEHLRRKLEFLDYDIEAYDSLSIFLDIISEHGEELSEELLKEADRNG